MVASLHRTGDTMLMSATGLQGRRQELRSGDKMVTPATKWLHRRQNLRSGDTTVQMMQEIKIEYYAITDKRGSRRNNCNVRLKMKKLDKLSHYIKNQFILRLSLKTYQNSLK